MDQIRRETVREIDAGRRFSHPRKRLAGGNPGGGQIAKRFPLGVGRQARQGTPPEDSRDEEPIAGSNVAPPQGLPRATMTDHRDMHAAFFRSREITADEGTCITLRLVDEAAHQRIEIADAHFGGCAQAHQDTDWSGPHRRKIRKVDDRCTATDAPRPLAIEQEMNAFDLRVRRENKLLAVLRTQQRRVIPDTEGPAFSDGIPCAPRNSGDQGTLSEVGKGAGAA
jgi:hypothetical protein